ncbi:MAG: hypothetical protein JST58_01550 [Bacteroidetes bacterium]|nr:hypothetical protein [Bacteroidota bacterium]
MKKRLSLIILATEIAAIVIIHSFKLSHQDKLRLSKPEDASQQQNISLSHSYSYSN